MSEITYPQWLRYFRLIVQVDGKEAVDLSQFRCVFNISQAIVGKPCTADIKVYNVSPETAEKIRAPSNAVVKHKRLKVVIEAGYEDSHLMIFQGDLWWRSSGRESETDTFIQLIAATGDRAQRFAVVNCSLPSGSTQADVFDAVTDSMKGYGIESRKRPDLMSGRLIRGKVIYKMASDAMQGVADTNRFDWGYGNEGIAIIGKDPTYNKSEDVIVLNSATGLIGRPTVTVEGVEAMCLLQPRIDVGSLVQIDNNSIQGNVYDTSVEADLMQQQTATDGFISADGIYRVLGREHYGDTRGNDWYTKIICSGVNASQTPMAATVLNNIPNL